MDAQTLYKLLVPVVVAGIGVIGAQIIGGLSRKLEKLKFKSTALTYFGEAIKDEIWKEKKGRLIFEEAFHQLYNVHLKWEEIKFLVLCDSPALAINTRIKNIKHIVFEDKLKKFTYKNGESPFMTLPYIKKAIPKSLIIGFFWYMILASTALYLFPVGMADQKLRSEIANFGMFILFEAVLGSGAILCLVRGLLHHFSYREIEENMSDIFKFD